MGRLALAFFLFSQSLPLASTQDQRCGDISLSLQADIAAAQNCSTMSSLTVAWNDNSPLLVELGNLTAVATDVYVFALTHIESIAFPRLLSIGGTLKIMSLQPQIQIRDSVFASLQSVGNQLMIGDINSHQGDIGTVRLTALAGLTVGNSIRVGGTIDSNIYMLEISKLLEIGNAPTLPSALSPDSLVVNSLGTVGEIHINANYTRLSGAPLLANLWGRIIVSVPGSRASVRLIILEAIRSFAGGIMYSGGANLPPIMINMILVQASQAAGMCGGLGILQPGTGTCQCWTEDPDRCISTLPTIGQGNLVTGNLTGGVTEDQAGAGVDESELRDSDDGKGQFEQIMFGFIPMWGLFAAAGGLLLLVICIALCRLRCRRRSSRHYPEKQLRHVAGIKEIEEVTNNIADLMWDDGLAAQKEGQSSPARRQRTNSVFGKSMKQKSQGNALMPTGGDISFDAPQEAAQLQSRLQSGNAPMTQGGFGQGMIRNARGGSFSASAPFNNRQARGGSMHAPSSAPPMAPPRPSLSMKRPNAKAHQNPAQFLAQNRQQQRQQQQQQPPPKDADASINLSLFQLSPATNAPERPLQGHGGNHGGGARDGSTRVLVPAGHSGQQPVRKKARSRRSVRASQLRRPALLAKRQISLEVVEETEGETEFDEEDYQEEDPGYVNHGEDDEELDLVPSALAREPTSGSQTSEISIADTDGTASDVGDTPSGLSRSGTIRPPPIALGRHPSLRHAPAGLRNAVIEQERKKNRSLDQIYGTNPLEMGEEEEEDVYEVPAMTRSPRTGRAIPTRDRNKTMTNAKAHSKRMSTRNRQATHSASTKLPSTSRARSSGYGQQSSSRAKSVKFGGSTGPSRSSRGGSVRLPTAPPRKSQSVKFGGSTGPSRSSRGGSVKMPTAPPRKSLKRPNHITFPVAEETVADEDENPYLLPAPPPRASRPPPPQGRPISMTITGLEGTEFADDDDDDDDEWHMGPSLSLTLDGLGGDDDGSSCTDGVRSPPPVARVKNGIATYFQQMPGIEGQFSEVDEDIYGLGPPAAGAEYMDVESDGDVQL